MAYTYGTVAKCKYGDGSTSSYYQCRLGYQVNSQSIENNTSNVTLRLEVRSTSSSYATRGYNQTSTIDGTSLAAATFDMSNTNVWQVFGTRTITVTHNADGTYSASKSASFTTTASGTYSLKSGTCSVTVAPATIPRASEPTLSASSIALGNSVTITTNRKSTSFTHTLTYKFGNATGTIGTVVGASTTFTPSLSLANQIPSATSGTCTITCQTYNGTTLVGTKTVNLTLTVPSSVVPSISSISLSEANTGVPSAWGCYVQNKSKLLVAISASGSYGSTITNYRITGIDSTVYNSANFTSGTLTQSGTKTVTVVVTDSRGRTATRTTTYTCLAYSNPTITSAIATRCDLDGTDNEEGEYIKYTFKANVSSVNSNNNHIFKIGYKLNTDSSYTYIVISNEDYVLNKVDIVLTDVIFSVDNSYNIQFYVGDYFTTSTQVQQLGTGFTLMDFNASGKSMAIGKVSEAGANEKILEVDLEGRFNKQIYMQNKDVATIEVGSNSNGNYLKFNDGTMLCWKKEQVTDQAVNNAYGSLYQGTRTYTFPVPFISEPVGLCSIFKTGTGAGWGTVSATTTTTIQLRGIDVISREIGTYVQVGYIAIGRWK